MEESIHKKAKEYAALMNDCYSNDYYGFVAGYKSALEDIRKKYGEIYNKSR